MANKSNIPTPNLADDPTVEVSMNISMALVLDMKLRNKLKVEDFLNDIVRLIERHCYELEDKGEIIGLNTWEDYPHIDSMRVCA